MKKENIILILIAVLVLTAGVFFGLWRKEKVFIDNQERQTQIEKNNNIKEREATETENQTEEKDLVYYRIPELGSKFKIDKELADELIYYYKLSDDIYGNSDLKSAYFSANELGKLGEYCKVEYGPMGSLVRYEGKPSDYDEPFNKIQEKNFYDGGDFFIVYVGSQAVCSGPENAEEAGSYMGIMTRAIGTPEKIKLIKKIDE